MDNLRFSARTITGAGRGRHIGTPTINMHLEDIPSDVEEGIYACWARLDDIWYESVLHYGPRPVFRDSVSCEVHLLDTNVTTPPERVEIQLVERLRPVLDFPSPDALIVQIHDDVQRTRGILEAHGSPDA